MPTVYEDVLKSLEHLSDERVKEKMKSSLESWQTFFEKTANLSDEYAALSALAVKLTGLGGAPDRVVELELVKLASENPVLGPAIVLAHLPATTAQWADGFWKALYSEETPKPQANPPATDVLLSGPLASWKVKTLLPPAPGRRYLIFSDVHRDDAADVRQPLEPGSIDHFSANAALFERILDHVGGASSGYTILEAGDCEELWFIRSVKAAAQVAAYPTKPDGTLDVATKLQRIIDSHVTLYAKLRELHRAGRYFRIQGNHDSFVRRNPPDDAVWEKLKETMDPPAGVSLYPPFEIYDACIIPGVKTMTEHGAKELFDEAMKYRNAVAGADANARAEAEKKFRASLLRSHLGLDSEEYKATAKMLVTHGHQFDFWNCETNEILGLLISNTAATFIDRHMDRILELRGIAWQGNPLVDFEDLFARLPVFSSWPKGAAALALAHRVQHMPDGQRELGDSIMFSESLVALWAAFGVALRGKDAAGNEWFPAQSRSNLNLKTASDLWEYLSRHHFHHVCIGHTHVPHSQPYFTLNTLAFFLPPPFSWLVRAAKWVLPGFLEPTVKSMYSNSGTTGWMEGVIWATEIDEKGQSRLVYWTDKTPVDKPETMDWELKPLRAEVKAELEKAYQNAIEASGAELSENAARLKERLTARLRDLNVAADALADALAHSITLPVQLLALGLVQQAKDSSRFLEEITDDVLKAAKGAAEKAAETAHGVHEAVDKAVDELEQQLQRLRSFTTDVFLSVRRRTFQSFASDNDATFLTIEATISKAACDQLLKYQRILMPEKKTHATGQATADRDRVDAALHHAGLAMAIFDGFPRNLPFFSNRTEASNHAARVHSSAQPVLQSLLSTLWMFPPAGQVVEVSGVAIRSRLTLSFPVVKLVVTLSKPGAPEPRPRDEDLPSPNVS